MTTPMMAQWQACKQQAQDALLLFRLGDFYEAFEQDALILAKELDLVLTKRQETPMAGIPFHTAEVYIDRLVTKGFRVAVAEQIEDPKQVKGLVKREIVRRITPGTVVQSSLLYDKSHNFIVCISLINSLYGLAVLDLTTAYFRVMEFDHLEGIFNELSKLQPKEILLSEKSWKVLEPVIRDLQILAFQTKPNWYFDDQFTYNTLLSHFRLQSLDGWGLKGMTAALQAAGALLYYLKDDLNINIQHLKTIYPQYANTYLVLDRDTQKHLEIIKPIHDQGKTLLSLLDQTVTPMGGRLLKTWILHPLLSLEAIQKRQRMVEDFFKTRLPLRKILQEIRDLERLMMRIETGAASGRDLVALRISLEAFPLIRDLLKSYSIDPLPEFSKLVNRLKLALVDTPPLRITEGGIFKDGYHEELDTLRSFKAQSQNWLAHYQKKLREETQIKTLKVSYTQAFGYYIEVSRGQSEKMPNTFQRRQTLVNSERYISPELKEFEHSILSVEEKILALETQLFLELRQEVGHDADRIYQAAQQIAHIDVYQSLAEVALQYRYVKPIVVDTDCLEIIAGRHPIVETLMPQAEFIPNSVHFSHQQRLHLITGPNMAGKSTFIRQVALIVLMAQMGSFVPAQSARIGIIDKLFTRIGASDNLGRGQSTFMVEMSETAHILHNATDKSLIILDEIGRGTSTYDGIAIAWSVADYLLTEPGKKAKTLFATHYFELTELEKRIEGAVNFHVAIHESNNTITFLRKIIPGATDKSYGIHVAKLAGFPQKVLKKADQILKQLLIKKISLKKGKDSQFVLF